ncbi:hypothetical protein NKG94_34220 [Micromonospora sp. M12]
MLTEDGKKADFNNAQGKQVLQNLKDMRYGDNSMGARQLLQWGDLLTNAGAGKVGMFIGAPDSPRRSSASSRASSRTGRWLRCPARTARLRGRSVVARATSSRRTSLPSRSRPVLSGSRTRS